MNLRQQETVMGQMANFLASPPKKPAIHGAFGQCKAESDFKFAVFFTRVRNRPRNDFLPSRIGIRLMTTLGEVPCSTVVVLWGCWPTLAHPLLLKDPGGSMASHFARHFKKKNAPARPSGGSPDWEKK